MLATLSNGPPTPVLQRKYHLRVVPYTVDDEAIMQRVIDLGVDGIISDYPDRLRTDLYKAGEYGVTHLICRVFFPGMPHRHIMRELELIAKEVRPAFA